MFLRLSKVSRVIELSFAHTSLWRAHIRARLQDRMSKARLTNVVDSPATANEKTPLFSNTDHDRRVSSALFRDPNNAEVSRKDLAVVKKSEEKFADGYVSCVLARHVTVVNSFGGKTIGGVGAKSAV
jgi:hypothetical protein